MDEVINRKRVLLEERYDLLYEFGKPDRGEVSDYSAYLNSVVDLINQKRVISQCNIPHKQYLLDSIDMLIKDGIKSFIGFTAKEL